MTTLAIAIVFFIAALFLQDRWISLMRRLDLGEIIKWYGPQTHKKKQGTPSIGGVVAMVLVPLAAAAVVSFSGASIEEAADIWTYPLLAASIGLLDDLLKKFRTSSEGLRSLQKLFLQIALTAPWAYWIARDGLFITESFVVSRIAAVPILIFVGTGLMNAVNVTDGLDGLASGAVSISLAAFMALARSEAAIFSAMIALAMNLAFLWRNAPPAELFMGDVGSHLWAGILLSLCIVEKRSIMIVPLGPLFGVEIATVAIQIFAIRCLHRKVFLMSPIHHHFELKGWAETKITSRFLIAHAVGIAILTAFFIGGGIL